MAAMQAGGRCKREADQLGLPPGARLVIAVPEMGLDRGLGHAQPIGRIDERWRVMGEQLDERRLGRCQPVAACSALAMSGGGMECGSVTKTATSTRPRSRPTASTGTGVMATL